MNWGGEEEEGGGEEEGKEKGILAFSILHNYLFLQYPHHPLICFDNKIILILMVGCGA